MNYTDPVNYYLDKIGLEASNQLDKRSFISFTNNVYESDNGWILENIKIAKFVSLSGNHVGYNFVGTSGKIGAFTIDSPQLRDVVKRKYLKLQDLIASIGGLVNFLSIALYALTFHYFKYEYYLFLFSLIEEIKLKSINSNSFSKVSRKNSIFKLNISKMINSNALHSNVEENNLNHKNVMERDFNDTVRIRELINFENNKVDSFKAYNNQHSNTKLIIKPNDINFSSDHEKNLVNQINEKEHSSNESNFKNSCYLDYLLFLLCCKKYFKNNTNFHTNNKINEVKEMLSIKQFAKVLIL